MAVIQISKIQVRRGQKLSGNGVPQLSSGEFAWAVDTQELYIGNGSLAEGSPYVGNTKILTENDSILRLVNSYRYGEGNSAFPNSRSRSIQNKIDEIQVSVVDFGANPDGSTDCTAAFHRAFEDIALSVDDKLKKIIIVPPGVYLFTNDLKIPSRVILRGENKYESVLEIGNNNIIFVSENETLPGNFSSSDLPFKIEISNLTIRHDDGQTIITSSQDCIFKDVNWTSNYLLGDIVFQEENAYLIYNVPIISSGGNITVSGTGVSSTIVRLFASTYVETLTNLVADLNNDTATFANFFEAFVEGTTLKIRSLSNLVQANEIANNFTVTSLANSNFGTVVETILPTLTEFTDGSQLVNASLYWDNDLFGRRTNGNKFYNCTWNNSRLAIEVHQTDVFDTYNDFIDCEFKICDTAVYVGGLPNQGNRWKFNNCTFEKIASKAVNINNGVGTHLNNCKFISAGTGTSTSQYPLTSSVKFVQNEDNILTNCSTDRIRLHSLTSLNNTTAVLEFENVTVSLIDKNYSAIYLSDGPRTFAVFSSGNKIITIDYVLKLDTHTRSGQIIIAVDRWNNDVSLTDNYIYSSGGTTMTLFQFDASLVSNTNTDDSTSVEDETLILSYVNPTGTGALGSITFSVSYGV